jgi:alpha-1,3/alpha-1,6-mannosyltransferase
LVAITGQADIILANSQFTARVFKTYFSSIRQPLHVVYPGINIAAYESDVDPSDPDIVAIAS